MKNPLRIVGRLKSQTPPEYGKGLRLSIYQGEGPVGTPEAVDENLARMAEVVDKAKSYRVHICIFPEKYNTGYAITLEQCHALAETVDGRSIRRAQEVAVENKTAIVLPYPEVDRSGAEPKYYDAIAFIGPDGALLANYRKTHLYGAAERRNYSFGNELPPVNEINGFPVGLLNCYECEFPPLYQHLAESGARLVIGPTAADHHFTLADGTESQVPYQDATRHIIPAMASVWKLFVCYANRRGWEGVPAGWWQYLGNSGLWAPNGETVIKAGPDEQHHDSLLIADCRPEDHPPFSPEGNHLKDNRLGLIKELKQGA
jgi:predicted amidohydrolase